MNGKDIVIELSFSHPVEEWKARGATDSIEVLVYYFEYKNEGFMIREIDGFSCLGWITDDNTGDIVGFDAFALRTKEEAQEYIPIIVETLGWNGDFVEKLFDTALALLSTS